MTPRAHLVSLPSLDALYTEEPEGFVAARNNLVRQLKAAGDKMTAAEVGQLRRPSVSAWALNQVTRRGSTEIGELFDAVAVLTTALEEPESSDLRAAQHDFRAAIEQTVRAALDVATASGRTGSAALQQAVQATLQAAAVDDGIATALRAGVLAADEPAPGFVFADAGEVLDRPSPSVARSAPAVPPAATEHPHPRPIGGRKKRSRSADDRTAPTSEQQAAEQAEAERSRLAAEEREAQHHAHLAELRAEVKRLEKRAVRLAKIADRAGVEARVTRAAADDASDQVDAVLAAIEEAEATG